MDNVLKCMVSVFVFMACGVAQADVTADFSSSTAEALSFDGNTTTAENLNAGSSGGIWSGISTTGIASNTQVKVVNTGRLTGNSLIMGINGPDGGNDSTHVSTATFKLGTPRSLSGTAFSMDACMLYSGQQSGALFIDLFDGTNQILRINFGNGTRSGRGTVSYFSAIGTEIYQVGRTQLAPEMTVWSGNSTVANITLNLGSSSFGVTSDAGGGAMNSLRYLPGASAQFDTIVFSARGAKATWELDNITIKDSSAPISGSEPYTPRPFAMDPRFPAEMHAQREVVSEDWMERLPWLRIQNLEIERNQILKELAGLPKHDLKLVFEYMGYHSLFGAPDPDGLMPPHQIDIILSYAEMIGSIALAPALNPAEPKGYAFPKRFKIEILNEDTGEYDLVVNWMDEDFPDPGPYPVFFSEINHYGSQVRITVPRREQEAGLAYFALGEVYLFRRGEGERIGDNMAMWNPTTIETSDSFTMSSIWNARYLNDGRTGFGLSLGDERDVPEDMLLTFDEEEMLSATVQLTLDLGQERNVGPVEFWPAAAPHPLAIPSFGFPEQITVETSRDPDFKTKREYGDKFTSNGVGIGGLFSIKCKGRKIRYIRITMNGLSEYQGKRILGLGEISASYKETIYSVNCKITAQGIPEKYMDQLPRLVDGYSRKRQVLPMGEWIKGLAQRRPLDRRLVIVERELADAQSRWLRIKQRSAIWAGVIVFLGLASGLIFQQLMRKRGINQLKWRIARDLHDDVGSNLGSISLTAEQLRHVAVSAEVKEELIDLSLMAREACASLREVVWVIDETSIRLSMLLQKLVERAERVLNGMVVSIETSEDCPDYVVSLTFKRNLIMFFKEMIHNCALHSHATQVWIVFSMIDQQLHVSVRDNGCGFDPTRSTGGWGLESMKERAEEMGGVLELSSRPEEGTTVALTVPLSALVSKTDHLYKTSN